jgi:hypothetical protein
MRGETSRSEAGGIVRHLLTGCGTCVQRTRTLWALGDPPKAFRVVSVNEEAQVEHSRSSLKHSAPEPDSPEGSAATETELARAQLREIARDLKGIRHRLRSVQASLWPSAGLTPDSEALLPGTLRDFLEEIESLTEGLLEAAGSPPEIEGEVA